MTVFLRILAALAIVLLPTWLAIQSHFAPQPPANLLGVQPIQVRVVWHRDAAHRARVLWTTAERGTTHRLHHDDRPRDGAGDAYRHTVSAVETARFPDPTGTGIEAWQHSVQLRDLPPDSPVHFAVSSDGALSRGFHFRTAPDRDRPVTVLAGGDCLDARTDRRRMNRRIAALADADPNVLAFAHQGDFVREGERLDEWLGWLEDHALATGSDGRLLPLIVARGNHEAHGPLFDFVFGAPGGPLRNWYVTELSPELVWITLNTNVPRGGAQRDFVSAALATHRDRRLRIAHYHGQLYPAVTKQSFARSLWAPVFEEGGLDLAVECNGHALKRTLAIRDGAPDPAGVVYIGEGGLGAKQRTPARERWYLQPPGFVDRGLHVWKLRCDARGVTMSAVLADGSVAHREVLPPRAER